MNRKIKSLFLFCAFFYGYPGVNAQDKFPHDNLSSGSTPSPNAGNSTYTKNITVDPYTGMLQAGFTLYSYKNASTGLTHDITIGYNAGGGIHVDDIASNIGLGWCLNTGGIITRSINDIADEFGTAVDTDNDLGVISQYLAQTADGQIDNYYYSAGGSSGRFIVGYNGLAYTIPSGNTKIQRTIGAYSPSSAPLDSCYSISYTVTLANGTRYIFSNFDCSKLSYNDTASIHNKYTSATWYLSMIVSAFNRDTIFFDYTPVVQTYYTGNSNSEYIYNSGSPTSPIYSSYQHTVDYNNRAREMRLVDVRYPDGTQVTFNYSTFNRLDLHSDNAIDNITIANGSSTYGYKFQYQYYEGTGTSNTIYSYQDYSALGQWSHDQRGIRLILKGFNLFSGSNNLPGYSFQYDSSSLPARGSLSKVDNWGFFSNNAGGKVPTVSSSAITFNRNPTFNTSGVLQKISLPTGGTIQVEYESNTTKSTLPDPAVVNNVWIKDSLYSQDSFLTVGYNNDQTVWNVIERTPSALNGKTILRDVIVTPSNFPSDLNSSTQINYTVGKWGLHLLTHQLNPVASTVFDSLDFALQRPKTIEFEEIGNSNDTVSSYNFTVPSGVSSSHFASINFKVKYQYYYTHSVPYYLVGGIRVKHLIESDNTGQNNTTVHEYNYMEVDGITHSGVVANAPVYNFSYTEDYHPATGDPTHPAPAYAFPNNPEMVTHYVNSSATAGTNYTYQVYTDAAVNSQILTHGSPVGYDRVTEYLGTAANYKKKTVYEFTTPTASPLQNKWSPNIMPFLPQPDLDYASGLPVAVSEYNGGGKLLQKTVNTYNTYTQSIQGLSFVEMKVGSIVYPAIDITSYKKIVYYPLTGKVVPAQTTTIQYYANGDSINSSTQFAYDTAKMVIRQTITTDSKGVPIVTKYYYPYDFSISGPITTLQNKGIIYDPLRVEVWKDTASPNLINANVATYQYLTDSSIKPLSDYSLTTAAPVSSGTFGSFNNTQLLQNPQYFTQQGTLDIYDKKGNLLQTNQNGMLTSFVWAYKNKYPIAKVENAKLSDIAYTSFEDGIGNWSKSGTSSSIFSTTAVTGGYAYSLASGNTLSKSSLDPTQTYILSFWSNSVLPSVTYSNGGSPTTVTPAGSDTHKGWRLYKVQITGANTITLTGSSTTVIDELRLYPKGAFMITTSFDPLYGMTSTCDASNRTSYFEYDVFGRLKYQRNFDRNIIKVYDYKNQEAQ